jgi:hypothetical protein
MVICQRDQYTSFMWNMGLLIYQLLCSADLNPSVGTVSPEFESSTFSYVVNPGEEAQESTFNVDTVHKYLDNVLINGSEDYSWKSIHSNISNFKWNFITLE